MGGHVGACAVAVPRAESGTRSFERQYPGGEDANAGEPGAECGRASSEIFPDDDGPSPLALHRKKSDKLAARCSDVGSFRRRTPDRNPELPEQPHHVVDAQRPHRIERPLDHAPPVGVTVRA